MAYKKFFKRNGNKECGKHNLRQLMFDVFSSVVKEDN
jgi:hypothetical protein